jgi:hypothetical protein
MVLRTRFTAIAAFTLAAAIAVAAQAPPPGPPDGRPGRQGQPPGAGRRDGAAQRDVAAPVGTGVIAGKVVAADTGRPVKRARVIAAGGGRPRAATTDDQGRFRITALPPGTYSITATKTGFVDGAFGQRRALRTGTPVDLAEAQQRADVDMKLSRGGVITGRVLDEDGEPLSRAMVTVLRQQYVRGEKQMTPAGTDQSDDRGQFRIFGLPPGDYFVSAAAGGVEQALRQLAASGRGGLEQVPESSGYAPTYYPGVIAAGDATRVKLAASQELSGIDFQLQIVPLATVKGVVVGGAAMVMLVPEEGGAPGGRGGGGRGSVLGAALPGGGLRSSTRQDGTFSIANVTPGKYTIIARADGGTGGGPKIASQPLVVAGEEVNVVLTPAPGVVLSGSVTIESAGTPSPTSFATFRVNPVPLGSSAAMPRMVRPAQANVSGEFSVPDVTAGLYVIRATGPRGWTMKSVSIGGREVTDQPLDVKSENVSGINIVFTDRVSGLSGTVRDGRGNAVSDLTVILFPLDENLWLPQSRRILTARADAAGVYKLTAVPDGDYLVAAVDDVEPGEWFDPLFLEGLKAHATKVKIAEGEQRTADLKAPSPS